MRMPSLNLPPPAAAAPLAKGQSLGVWRLQLPLPDGEQAHAGQWYGAHHNLATQQQGAVLVLNKSEQAAGIMLRFADQAGDLAQLKHPHIAVPSDSGITPEGQPYLIVEGSHGKPLLPVLHELSLRQRVELLVQLCEAMRSAHQQGWLLAELDPAMIWRTHEGELCLMGMGLARIPDPSDPFDRGLSLGASPAFVAPERRAGGPPSLASEVYGLGAFARVLFCGWEDTPKGLAPQRGSCADQWPHLEEDKQIGLDALLSAATAVAIEDRPVGAEALADALRDWLGVRRVVVASAQAPAQSQVPKARKRWWWFGAAASLCLLGWGEPQTQAVSRPAPATLDAPS